MAKWNRSLKSHLENTFRDRVTFDAVERMLYGHDIAALPGLMKPLIGDTTPDAVVQPVSEEELQALTRWAGAHGIPLTPRGKASSGYGGVLPVQQGIVVDFYRLRKVLAIDADKQTVTVQPGIVWEALDRELKKKGLTLLTYPSSYPGSTAGGWLAQGGAGFGSYEAGWFRDTVLSARVVLPDGSVRVFTGDELDLVSEAEGITGLISEITLHVRPDEPMELLSVGCPDPQDLQRLLESFVAEGLPIWSIVFINPKMAELKNQAPGREHWGHEAEERVILPVAYIATLTFRRKDGAQIRTAVERALKACRGEILSDRIARHEWEHRFKLMVVKRLGPSLVPAEVVIPLSSFGDYMKKVGKLIQQPIVKEGVIVRKSAGGVPEVVILGFIPSDERSFSYNFVFPLSLTVMKIAESCGGRAYSTGLYFKNKAKAVLGEKRLAKLEAFKAQADPKGIMNPGKVVGGGLIGMAVRLGSLFEPLIRPFSNAIVLKIGERPKHDRRDIPADVAWYAQSCSQCGYCVDECDQFYGRGWESQSPRGKWYWLREYMKGKQEWTQKMVDTFLVCTTCELCNLRCSASLPIEPSWMKLRGKLINDEKRMTFPPFEMMAAATLKEGNIWAGYGQNRSAWFPEDMKARHGVGVKAKTVYFAGCTASYVEPDIGQASVRLLDRAGVDFTTVGDKENCCGTPMLVAGKWDVYEEIMRRNIKAVKEAGADTVICSCPACDMMWRHAYPVWTKKLGIEFGIKAKHYSEVLAEKIRKGEFTFPDSGREPVTVTWHDSCHMGRVSGIYEEPRELIKAIPHVKFVEMDHHREEAHCCGSVLTLIKDPPIAADLGEIRLNEALKAGASKVLALCPCCEFQFRVTVDKKKLPLEVVDLAHFTAAALGMEFPDPNPEVQRQWAVFEAMIALMTPRGFANLMGSMWPELIDAMPFGMGTMMRAMGRIPGALNLMKPLFPILFPRLLPMMMPKVMPTMLARVAERIPMPDYMREQMPELMPKVMDNLMPHMIADVVPLVTQPMIDYLQGKAKAA